jgi:hypothetical protein
LRQRTYATSLLLLVAVGFVIRADEFLLLNEFVDDMPIELSEIFRKPLAKNLKPAMPAPKIPNPVTSVTYRLALELGSDATFSPPQEACPNPARTKNNFKLSPLTFSDPEPAVDDEPRRRQSLRRSLHLRDDFLRNRPRSLLIARKVHRVLGAALR